VFYPKGKRGHLVRENFFVFLLLLTQNVIIFTLSPVFKSLITKHEDDKTLLSLFHIQILSLYKVENSKQFL